MTTASGTIPLPAAVQTHLAEFDLAAIPDLDTGAKEIAARVQSDAAVTLRNIIPAAMASELREALIAAEAMDAKRFGKRHPFPGIVHALMTRDPVFLRCLETPGLHAISRALLGHGCIVNAFNSSSMPPGQSNYSSRIHVDSPRLIPGYVTNVGFIIALDAFSRNNGAMEIAPSLAGRTVAPSDDEFEAAKVILDHLVPGDAVCFNVRCWHRGGRNQTDTTRHAVTLNVCRNFMRQQFDYPRMLGESQMSLLGPDLQQFLGYFVRMPSSMEEFLLPPEIRPYRPGQE